MKRTPQSGPKPQIGASTSTQTPRAGTHYSASRRSSPASRSTYASGTSSAPPSARSRRSSTRRSTGRLPVERQPISRPAHERTHARSGDDVERHLRDAGLLEDDSNVLPFESEDAEIWRTVRERRHRRGFASRMVKSWRKARRVTPREDNPFEHALDEVATVGLRARGRKARKRIKATTWLFGLGAAGFWLCLTAMTFSVMQDLNSWQTQANNKQVQLTSLQDQLETGRKRLSVLQSPKGREQLLMEHGYIKPGDRILLFPATPEEKQAAQIPKNDLTAKPTAIEGNRDGSAWRRAGETLRGWWQGLTDSAPKTTNG